MESDLLEEDILNCLHHTISLLPSLCRCGSLTSSRKTQIALEYGYWAKDKHPELLIFWVVANTVESFRENFSKIAWTCDIPGRDEPHTDILALVKIWLETQCRYPWLMIVDSADDSEVFKHAGRTEHQNTSAELISYIPACSRGSLLVTSRFKRVAVDLIGLQGKLIRVRGMEDAESDLFIAEALEKEDVIHDLDPHDVRALATKLENIPLALAQAVSYIKVNSITVKAYVQLVKQTQENDDALPILLEQDFQAEGRDFGIPNAVAASWMLSFDQIQRQYPRAAEVLCLMSCFDRHNIPERFLLHETKSLEEELRCYFDDTDDRQNLGMRKYCPIARIKKHGFSIRKSLKWRTTPYNSASKHRLLELTPSLGVLKGFSLISASKDGQSFTIHRLVQLIVRRWLSKTQQLDHWTKKAVLTALDLFPNYLQLRYLQTGTECFRHSFAVVQLAQSLFEKGDSLECLALGRLLAEMAEFLDEKGIFDYAEQTYKLAITASEKVGESSFSVRVSIILQLAYTYSHQLAYEKAEDLLNQTINLCLEKVGPENWITLSVYAALADIYNKLDRQMEAEKLLLMVIYCQSKYLGPEHKDTLSTKQYLSHLFNSQKRFQEAEELLLEVVKTHTRIDGPGNLKTLFSVAELAWTYGFQQRHEDAAELLKSLVRGTQKKLGKNHPFTLDAMYELAQAWQKMGRTWEALQVMGDTAELREYVLGESHRDTRRARRKMKMWQEDGGKIGRVIQA